MAAPTDVTMKNLAGEWVMDKTISNPTEPVLALQGMGWMTRKALNMATITLNVKHAVPDPAKPTVHQIDIAQSLTGGIPGTSETRITDWEKRLHEDHVFGKLDGQSRYLRGSSVDGKVRPAVVVNTKVDDAVLAEKVSRFLRGEILADGAETEGFLVETEAAEEFGEGEGLWLQSFVVNEEKKWTAEQVWGFENINGQRLHCRRVVVAKDGKCEMARLVYSFSKKA
ncbi:uncharacterized protein BDW47DRAFT_102167 [Aspergillus candidus]|uniref:Uncharacterized protein n=1 Tax=Aspergillus candidus TaxID=41067 RepID=A0A2I2FHF5_ASPCN|nr:hypothetical protein BDW47DRAFT_102167 [Aspergillus candidus]PLB40054.1 hypothetical protein BDW47DRAFT_102167 [Aspergillus candidus]